MKNSRGITGTHNIIRNFISQTAFASGIPSTRTIEPRLPRDFQVKCLHKNRGQPRIIHSECE